MTNTYILQAGSNYKIDIDVQFQAEPSVSVDESLMLTTYAGAIMTTTETTLKTQIAEKQLTSPELLGWNVQSVSILSKNVIFSTSIFNTNPILKMELEIIIDGTKSTNALTLDISSYSTWYDNATFYIAQFFNDFAYKYNPFLIVANSIKIVVVDIIKAATDIVKWFERTIKGIEDNWVSILVIAGLIGAAVLIYLKPSNN